VGYNISKSKYGNVRYLLYCPGFFAGTMAVPAINVITKEFKKLTIDNGF
jgi:hypothetical protein